MLMLLWPLFVTELTVIAFAKKVVIFIIVVVNNGISINLVSAAVEYVAFVTFTVSDVFFVNCTITIAVVVTVVPRRG